MSKFLNLSQRDFLNGLVMAVLGGIALPVLAAIQTPDFNVFTVNWQGVGVLALNGGVAAFAGYLTKNLFTAENGKVFGKI